MNLSGRRNWMWMLPLLLLAFWLGVRMLNYDIFWFDEIRALDYASLGGRMPRPFDSMFEWLIRHKWQSPAYYVLLSQWGIIFGWGHFGGRMSALLIGIVALAWMYRLGRDMFSPREGLFAAVMLLGSSLYVYYLHEMRPYSLYLLLTITSVWSYYRIIAINEKQQPSLWLYLSLFLSLTGLAYTHALALLTPLSIGLYHLLFAPKNQRWLVITGVMTLAGLAALPWIIVSLGISDRAIVDTARIGRALYGTEIVQTLLYTFGNGHVLLLLTLLGLGFLDKWRSGRLLIVWIVATVGIAMLISYIIPAFIHIKYLMAAWPALALFSAAGLNYLAERRVAVLLIMAIWLTYGTVTSLTVDFYESLPNSDASIPREGFEQFVQIVEAVSHEDDLILMHTSPLNWEGTTGLVHGWYFRNTPAEVTHLEMVQPAIVEADEALYMQAVSDVIHNVPVIWTGIVPKIPQTFRNHAFFKQLATTHALCQHILDRDDMQMSLYAQSNPNKQVASFGDGLVMSQMLWELPQITTANTLNILLGNQRDAQLPPDTYSIGLHLLNANGELVRQVDYGLPNDAFSCRWSQLDLNGLAEGEYTLSLLIYNWQTLEPLAADTVTAESHVEVGQITISQEPE